MNSNDSRTAGDINQAGIAAARTPNPLAAFQSAAWACAHSLLANVTYIQKELPTLDIPDAQRGAITNICSTLIGTKHDVTGELFDLQEIDEPATSITIQGRVGRIQQMFAEDLMQLHEVAKSLDVAQQSDASLRLAYLLVAESAGNMFRSFGEVMDAAERYGEGVAKTPLAPVFSTSMRK